MLNLMCICLQSIAVQGPFGSDKSKLKISTKLDVLIVMGSKLDTAGLNIRDLATRGILGFELKTKKLNPKFFRQALIEFFVFDCYSQYPFINVYYLDFRIC